MTKKTTPLSYLRSFLADPMRVGVYKTVLKLNGSQISFLEENFPYSFRSDSIFKEDSIRYVRSERLNYLLLSFLDLLNVEDNLEQISLIQTRIQKNELELKEYNKKNRADYYREIVGLRRTIAEDIIKSKSHEEAHNFKLKYKSKLKSFFSFIKSYEFISDKFDADFEGRSSEPFGYFNSMEKKVNSNHYLIIRSIGEKPLLHLLSLFKYLFGSVSTKYVHSHNYSDIRLLYFDIFSIYIDNHSDSFRNGKYVTNIKKSIDNFNEKKYEETNYYLGLAIEELLETIYENLFYDRAPVITIAQLLKKMKISCFELGANSLNDLIKKRLENKLKSNEATGQEEKNIILFTKSVDNAVIRSTEVRNKNNHRQDFAIQMRDCKEMVIGLGMLYRWWESSFVEVCLKEVK